MKLKYLFFNRYFSFTQNKNGAFVYTKTPLN
nr:MAG TPA: hypothetical protein [Caudoviricetes sp.]DAZ18747.1 MAG TPA: hypothetical protein [Caudoviricetes sp.]DAZ45318.1 MAG TPA: hypothetical protein [Caudoviricetes sp.]